MHGFRRSGIMRYFLTQKLPVAAAEDGSVIVQKHNIAIATCAGRPGPLPTEERGKPARFVMLPRGFSDLIQVFVREDEVIALVGSEVDSCAISSISEVLVWTANTNSGCSLCLCVPPANNFVDCIANDYRDCSRRGLYLDCGVSTFEDPVP